MFKKMDRFIAWRVTHEGVRIELVVYHRLGEECILILYVYNMMFNQCFVSFLKAWNDNLVEHLCTSYGHPFDLPFNDLVYGKPTLQ